VVVKEFSLDGGIIECFLVVVDADGGDVDLLVFIDECWEDVLRDLVARVGGLGKVL
jgi:hypothetical protein